MSIQAFRCKASIIVAMTTALFLVPAHARSQTGLQAESRPVDLVLALDVSGSMSGLIESAKQRLWDVVNELYRAQPKPDLRVAVLSYGNPAYGKSSGFVRVDVPLTQDLDAVNEALFGFSTNGGSEYVARVIARATETLQWSEDPQALRILFVAGNEAATQDPKLSVDQVVSAARARDIVVNTIYCAAADNGGTSEGWKRVAQHAGGFYASIDQNVAAVAIVTTPYDEKLRALNAELNKTYLPYGDEGENRRENQLRQDSNAAEMSAPAAASRAVTKAGRAYRAADWDLVDALEAGAALGLMASRNLPAPMRSMSEEERETYVEEHAKKREAIRTEIEALAKDRQAYIERERSNRAQSARVGLDGALKEGLRGVAETKGFRFE